MRTLVCLLLLFALGVTPVAARTAVLAWEYTGPANVRFVLQGCQPNAAGFCGMVLLQRLNGAQRRVEVLVPPPGRCFQLVAVVDMAQADPSNAICLHP